MSGLIVIGVNDGQVEMWQTAPPLAPHIGLPIQTCLREQQADARAQVKDIEAILEEEASGLRQQMAREQELMRTIADLEARCACMISRAKVLTMSSQWRPRKRH